MLRLLPRERRGFSAARRAERSSSSAEDAVAVAYVGRDRVVVGQAGAPAGRYEKAIGRRVELHLGQNVAVSGKLLPHCGQFIV